MSIGDKPKAKAKKNVSTTHGVQAPRHRDDDSAAKATDVSASRQAKAKSSKVKAPAHAEKSTEASIEAVKTMPIPMAESQTQAQPSVPGRRMRPVLALLPEVRAARVVEPAAQPAATAEPTPLPAVALNPESVPLDVYLARRAATSAASAAPTSEAPALAPVTTTTTTLASATLTRSSAAAATRSKASTQTQPSKPEWGSKLRRPVDSYLDAKTTVPVRSAGQTLAERLEMSKLAREAKLAVDPLDIAAPWDSMPTPHVAPAFTLPAPSVAHTAPSVQSNRAESLASEPLPERPASKPAAVRKAPTAARNSLLGMALSYFEDFQKHIGGPVAALWLHRRTIGAAMMHVMIPLIMAFVFSHWNPSMQAIFLEGGAMANLGFLSWLVAISAFVWSLVYIIGARIVHSLRFDWGRFERIGRGFMSPHRNDD